MKKIIAAILGAVLCLTFFGGCANKGDAVDYNYSKESDTMLHFSSSDEGLDAFLNDYLHRHLRYDDYRIGDLALGNSVMFNKEWEAMSLFFFDSTSTAVPDDRVEMMENFLYNIPVDKFGYTWQAFNSLQPAMGEPTTYFGQGWPFPDYAQSNGYSNGWEFNGASTQNWTAEVDGVAYPGLAAAGGLMTADVEDAENLSFISPLDNIATFHAPFLEVDLRLLDTGSFGKDSKIDQINIYWKTSESEDWSDNKKVTKEFATLPIEISSAFSQHIYFPMWLHKEWGTDKSIRQLKIEIVAKDGEVFSGPQSVNFVRCNYDTRHSNNSCLLLDAGKLHFEYTGDEQVLADNLNRYRMTTQFLLTHLNGSSGLIDQGYFPGHEGSEQGVGTSIGNGYWDILSTPRISFYSNIYFYKAIRAMAYLEKAAEDLELNIPKPSVVDAAGTGTVQYTQTSESLNALLETIKGKICETVDFDKKTGFWDAEKGRFIEGFNANGEAVDYGFIMFNLEAIAEGIATPEQSELIMDWVNGDRIIESDMQGNEQDYAVGKKGTAVQPDGSLSVVGSYGIYDLEFAPRSTTVKNYNQYVWAWGGTNEFGEQVQDGGAIMYVSYYDIMSRIKTRGADDAFGRLKEIQAWYEKVQACAERNGVGTDLPNDQFYRVYYGELGIAMQGGGPAGGIGLDTEFLESALLYATVPYGFFGIESELRDTLQVTPQLPSSLTWWKMENLAFNQVVYDLTIGKNFVQIDSVRGITDGLYVQVNLQKPGSGSKVYVDGVETSDYTEQGNMITVRVPMRASKIEIK